MVEEKLDEHYRPKAIQRKSIQKAISRMKMDNAAGADIMPGKLLKYGGEAIIIILCMLHKLTQESGKLPDDCKKSKDCTNV